MGAQDDFGLWEQELGPGGTDRPEPSGLRGPLVIAVTMAVGCTVLITLGEGPLGVAGLVLTSMILLLWRAGL
ncbi:hypothetical protein [Actinomadura harenae]|uniref:Uncharacterized protein n=1 Tax=Actinomadura harenae TaxID=2483351 RepID=A0A3M2LLS3_9ACTN|nr:hypothetical protein [Actinomadura harenae]RMI38056.1 hypothetical protein EBO15_34055 [Actinomadura harenae]